MTETMHARLGASSAHRWMKCPPSVALAESLGLDRESTSAYAREGNLAHELGAIRLHGLYHPDSPTYMDSLAAVTERIREEGFDLEEMGDGINAYVAFILGATKSNSLIPNPAVWIEEKVDFSEWVPNGFGTADAIVVGSGVLHVIDFKYGKGVPVFSEDNPQLRLYGLGAWATIRVIFDVSTVKMSIVQPRMNNISTTTMPLKDLLTWAEDVVRPAARAAHDGTGEFYPSEDTCRWCLAKGACKARAASIVQQDFSSGVDAMTPDEIGRMLVSIPEIRKWCDDVTAHAFYLAQDGTRIPGYKIVTGTPRARIADQQAARVWLADEGYPEIAYTNHSLKSLTDLKKLIGKDLYADFEHEFIVRPDGAPVLVPESDKRPEWDARGSVVADFGDDDE